MGIFLNIWCNIVVLSGEQQRFEQTIRFTSYGSAHLEYGFSRSETFLRPPGRIHEVQSRILEEPNFEYSRESRVGPKISSLENEVLPLVSNLSVSAFVDNRIIRLNISWDQLDDQDLETALVTINSTDNDAECSVFLEKPGHPISNGSIIRPDLKISIPSEDQEIRPGCSYQISLESEETNRKSSTVFQVPECVGDICDCRLYKPVVNIVEVQTYSQDEFIVKWDLGKLHNDKPYHIIDVKFDRCRETNRFSPSWAVHTIDVQETIPKHFVRIRVDQLPTGPTYNLSGFFFNNLGCKTLSSKLFQVSESSSNIYVIVFVIVSICAIAVWQYQQIIKFGIKVFSILTLGSNRRSTDNTLSLSHFENNNLQVPMLINLQYTPAEFMQRNFDKFEFPRNRIIISQEIGSGAFGKVYSAKIFGTAGNSSPTMVAVKTIGENASKEEVADFISEIEIFKKVDEHPNIVKLLGCCTLEMPYMMIMEFVPCGDLKNYLLDLRKKWGRKKNTQKFFPDTSDGAYIVPESPTSPASATSSNFPTTARTTSTLLEDPHTPSTGSVTTPLDSVLDHTELQDFALQIAKGMAHLEKIPITHRDLAARNILINEYKVLKISDFGLSRKGPYVNHRLKKLPLRWMSIEAIIDQVYDSKSDVWSFGVVLWEIGTLGAFPYEKVPDSFLISYLQMGRRLERPEICTNELYLLMMQCWAQDPDDRPSFEELVENLDVRRNRAYVDFSQLNPSYVFPPSELSSFQSGANGKVLTEAVCE